MNTTQAAKRHKIVRKMPAIGDARHVVSFYDGAKTHEDGSPFYEVRIFATARATATFIAHLRSEGYRDYPSDAAAGRAAEREWGQS